MSAELCDWLIASESASAIMRYPGLVIALTSRWLVMAGEADAAAVVSAAFLALGGWWSTAPDSETVWNIIATLFAALIAAGAVSKKHSWRTREDSFAEIWEEVRSKLDVNSGLQAKTLFKDLQRCHPGQYQDGQLRTLQRRVKQWRALEGPPKEVFFEQRHEPGELCQSDFTNMNKLGVRIQGQPFDHLIYHFVMTYSNWEWGTVCFSESFESLSVGFQSAVWKLGGVLFFTLNREDFSFVIHLDRQPRTSRRREAQTGSRARSGSRSERTLDAVEHSRTLMEWWPFLIFHRGGLRIKVINNREYRKITGRTA